MHELVEKLKKGPASFILTNPVLKDGGPIHRDAS